MLVIIIALVVAMLIFVFYVYHSKINFLNTKINTIEEKINSTLIKRKELLSDSESIIKQTINTNKTIYEGFDKVISNNMIEFDRKLLIYMKEFYLIKDRYEELQKNEEFQKLSFALNETEDLLAAYKTFYNDSAQKYNKLISSFPLIIISFITKNKKKQFFDEND